MDTLTHTQLDNFILSTIKGATFVSVRAETPQSTLNKGRGENAMIETIGVDPNEIVKHADVVFLISGGTVSYQDMVDHKLIKEARVKAIATGEEVKKPIPFNAKEHRWGKLLHDGCNAILTHKNPEKGGRYLIAYFAANNEPKVKHTYKGEYIDLTEARFDAYRKAPKKEGERQGTEDPVIIRDYKFDNIKEITMFKKTYKVIPD